MPVSLYLALPNRNYYWDGIGFSLDVERALKPGAGLFLHPNHILYNPLGYAGVRLLGIRSLTFFQSFNSILAGLTLVLLYRTLRHDGTSREVSAMLVLIFAFSATWWKFAADADSYIAAVLLLLACYRVLVSERPSPFSVALLHATAILFHQLAVVFFPAALFGLYTNKRRVRPALVYAVTAASLTFGGYVLANRIDGNGPFIPWMTSHAADAKFTFNPVRDAALTVQSSIRLFFGGKLSQFRPDAPALAGVALVLIAVGYLARRRISFSGLLAHGHPHKSLLLVWIGTYLAFLFVWLPQHPFYRLHYLPALLMFAAPAAERMDRKALAAITLAVFSWNFAFLTYPNFRPENNAPLAFALSQKAAWPAGTAVIYSRFQPDLWTISYFNPQAEWIAVQSGDLADIEALKQRHSHVWIDSTAHDAIVSTPEGRAWIRANVMDKIVVSDPKHRFEFDRIN